MIKHKLKEWIKRYGPSQLAAFILAVLGANLGMFLFNNIIIAAYIATWADNFGYYGIILFKDLRNRRKKDKGFKSVGLLKVIRNLTIEFGPAEYLDSFFLRPFYLTVVPLFIPFYNIAIIIGTVLADITFYLPTVLGYESRKKIFKD